MAAVVKLLFCYYCKQRVIYDCKLLYYNQFLNPQNPRNSGLRQAMIPGLQSVIALAVLTQTAYTT